MNNAISQAASPPEPEPDRLAGEPGIPDVAQKVRTQVSVKGLLALGLLVVSLVGVSAYSIHRYASDRGKSEEAGSKRAADRPTAATLDPRRPDMAVTASASAAGVPPSAIKVPALIATADESAEPIGVRRTGEPTPGTGGPKVASPVDAPVMLLTGRSTGSRPTPGSPSAASDSQEDGGVSAARQRLESYQRQLQSLLDNLTRSASAPTQSAAGLSSPSSIGQGLSTVVSAPAPGTGLFAGQLQGSATPRASATMLGNRSLTLPKGTAFTCALKTRVVSATSGLVGCQVQRNVYSDDGRVLLIERGSHMDGEYRVTAIRPGTVRIPVLWTRIRTPEGVVVDIDSPGTGPLGESGIDGYVDNRWFERIGAAMLLSLIDDAVNFAIQSQQNSSQADTVILPSTAGNTSKLAEKVLDSTINIPPLIYQNHGAIVGIYVARDVDFSSVYELKATPR